MVLNADAEGTTVAARPNAVGGFTLCTATGLLGEGSAGEDEIGRRGVEVTVSPNKEAWLGSCGKLSSEQMKAAGDTPSSEPKSSCLH